MATAPGTPPNSRVVVRPGDLSEDPMVRRNWAKTARNDVKPARNDGVWDAVNSV